MLFLFISVKDKTRLKLSSLYSLYLVTFKPSVSKRSHLICQLQIKAVAQILASKNKFQKLFKSCPLTQGNITRCYIMHMVYCTQKNYGLLMKTKGVDDQIKYPFSCGRIFDSLLSDTLSFQKFNSDVPATHKSKFDLLLQKGIKNVSFAWKAHHELQLSEQGQTLYMSPKSAPWVFSFLLQDWPSFENFLFPKQVPLQLCILSFFSYMWEIHKIFPFKASALQRDYAQFKNNCPGSGVSLASSLVCAQVTNSQAF